MRFKIAQFFDKKHRTYIFSFLCFPYLAAWRMFCHRLLLRLTFVFVSMILKPYFDLKKIRKYFYCEL